MRVDGHERRVKVEWEGPSDSGEKETANDYYVIDYERIMKGNPTIKNVFQFWSLTYHKYEKSFNKKFKVKLIEI